MCAFFFFPHFICIQSMAGCGLSEDTLFSSFFYNYGSSWETPSNQVRGGSVPGGVAPLAPCRALTWYSVGRQRLGRGWGGWGPSGSHCLGQRQPARGGTPPSPIASFPVSRFCRVPPVPHLPSTPSPTTSQPSGNPRKRQEPARYPEQLQAEPGNSSATFPKSPRAPRPCAPGAYPPSSCAEGLQSRKPPATCCPPSTPLGARAASFPKMAAISSRGVP